MSIGIEGMKLWKLVVLVGLVMIGSLFLASALLDQADASDI